MTTWQQSALRHPVLDVRNVSKAHDGVGGLRALRDISFRVERGEHVAITGSAPAQLLDLLCLIVGLDAPAAGRYLLDGTDLAECDEQQVARLRSAQIGIVYRNINLVPGMSALANVELPLAHVGIAPAQRRQRAMAALDAVGMADLAGRTPALLSDGEQQRTAIARALVVGPALIVADDPTAELDEVGAAQVLDLFDRLNEQGVTIVVLSTDSQVAARADRRITLSGGRVADDPATPALAG